MAMKDFSTSRAAKRIKQVSEEEAMFGVSPVAQQPESSAPETKASAAALASRDESDSVSDSVSADAKKQKQHQMTLIMPDDLYYDLKGYLASRDCPYTSANAMIRDLVSQCISKAAS